MLPLVLILGGIGLFLLLSEEKPKPAGPGQPGQPPPPPPTCQPGYVIDPTTGQCVLVSPPPPAGQCPAGQLGTPPFCLPVPTDQCPEGTTGFPPICVPIPGWTKPDEKPAAVCPAWPQLPAGVPCPSGQQPAPMGECPQGTTGIPPDWCFKPGSTTPEKPGPQPAGPAQTVTGCQVDANLPAPVLDQVNKALADPKTPAADLETAASAMQVAFPLTAACLRAEAAKRKGAAPPPARPCDTWVGPQAATWSKDLPCPPFPPPGWTTPGGQVPAQVCERGQVYVPALGGCECPPGTAWNPDKQWCLPAGQVQPTGGYLIKTGDTPGALAVKHAPLGFKQWPELGAPLNPELGPIVGPDEQHKNFQNWSMMSATKTPIRWPASWKKPLDLVPMPLGAISGTDWKFWG